MSLYFLLVLATPLLIGEAARMAAAMVRIPGLALDEDVVVSADERWPAVRPGDHLIAVDGVNARTPASAPSLLNEVPATAPVIARFGRGDLVYEVVAPVTPLPAYYQAAIWIRVAVGALCMFIGLVAFLLRPGTRTTWLFLVFCFDFGASLLILLALAKLDEVNSRAILVGFTLGTSLGVHLFLDFPRQIPFLAGRPWRAAWLYLPVVPVVVAVFIVSPASPARSLVARIVYAYAGLAGLVLSLPCLLYMYARCKRAGDREALTQYRTLIAALAFGMALPGVWNMLRLVFGFWRESWFVHLNTAPILVFVALFGYAIVRQNLLAVDRFTAAVVGYAATIGLLGAGFTLALVGVPLLVGHAGLSRSPELLVGATVLAFASFLPLYRLVKRRIDRVFLRDHAGEGRMTEELRELMRVIQRGDREKSLTASLNAVRVLAGEQSQLWTLDAKGDRFKRLRCDGVLADDSPDALPRASNLGQAILAGKAGGPPNLAARALPDAEAQGELWSLGLAMAAPVPAHGVVAGFLGVGRKRSGTRWKDEELSYLTAVATQVGMALERSTDQSAQLGRYRIERRLGVGGMAEVFLAWQIGVGGFERKVALKRPLPELMEDPQSVAMFLDEARIAAQLSHRHIAQLIEIDKQGGTYFIAMEYVDGPSLRPLIRALDALGQPAPLAVVAAVGQAVLAALGYAHALEDQNGRPLGIVHRDVTPSNVMLTLQGDVKLVDFGIARSASRLSVTSTGVVRGTVAYMSPEQAAGRPVDARADLFSLAVILYELLTLRRPFPDGPLGASPAVAPAGGPEELDEVLRKALAFDPADRYPDAASMRTALLAAITPLAAPADEAELVTWQQTLEAKAWEAAGTTAEHTIRGSDDT